MSGADLLSEGQTYWFSASASCSPDANTAISTLLRPAYDEYTVACQDRRAVVDGMYTREI
jgi:hypothetical protein